MRQDRYYFNALMVLETGKSWPEADGDTAEAIDFMEFYARQMMKLALPQELTPYDPEENCMEYIPLGVCLVIPPWNFPNAIMVGMTTAAIVAGNTVVLKPSSDASVIASKFAELMEEVGLLMAFSTTAQAAVLKLVISLLTIPKLASLLSQAPWKSVSAFPKDPLKLVKARSGSNV